LLLKDFLQIGDCLSVYQAIQGVMAIKIALLVVLARCAFAQEDEPSGKKKVFTLNDRVVIA